MLLRAAEAREEAKDYERAAELARDAVQHSAVGDPIAEPLLSRVELAAGLADRVVDRLIRRVSDATDDPSRALALESLAEIELLVRGDSEAALTAYRGILETYPAHVASMRAVERLSMQLGDDAGLAKIESELARLGHAADAPAHARLAVRFYRRLEGDVSESADALLLATLDYGEADLWLAREVEAIARRTGDERRLLAALTEMAERLDDPREQMALELRAAELTARTRSASAAINRLSRAMANTPKYPVASEILGELRERGGDAAGAADAYAKEAVRARADARRAALFLRAGVLFEEGAHDTNRATAAYVDAAKADATVGDVLVRLERLAPVQGRAAELADIVQARIAKGGDRRVLVGLHRMIARIKAGLGDHATAKKSLRTVTTLEPENVDVLIELARLCKSTNDSRGAIEALQKIVVQSRDEALLRNSYLALADLFAEGRDIRRTKEVLRKVLELFPNDTEAKQRLAMLDAH
jgi:tetratricopeptide (TPR) repeat protein